MARKQKLAQHIEAAGINARLDEACKRLLGNRIILAWILKSVVDEFKDYDVGEIADMYIEGSPVIAATAVHQDESGITGESIRGEDTVDKTISEGTVTFDIRFRAVVPSNGKVITLILNVEAQNDFYPGYPLVKRGIYYCCRLVSGQHGTEFSDSHYEKLKKVYSIFICINPPKNHENTITKYEIMETNLKGEVREPVENYDMMTAVMMCLGKKAEGKAEKGKIAEEKAVEEQPEGTLKLLTVLLSSELEAGNKMEILEKDFGIPMTGELEKEVTQMCNYSKGVEEKGIRKGLSQGIQQGLSRGIQQGIQEGIQSGTFITLCSLVQDGLIPAQEAAKRMNLSTEEFLKKMKDTAQSIQS